VRDPLGHQPPAAKSKNVTDRSLRTAEGRRRYLRRQASIEPVIGIIKKVLGFEQFLLRTLAKVSLEWTLVCTAFNLKRLHKLVQTSTDRAKAIPSISIEFFQS
jgi:Transposase DDE domain